MKKKMQSHKLLLTFIVAICVLIIFNIMRPVYFDKTSTHGCFEDLGSYPLKEDGKIELSFRASEKNLHGLQVPPRVSDDLNEDAYLTFTLYQNGKKIDSANAQKKDIISNQVLNVYFKEIKDSKDKDYKITIQAKNIVGNAAFHFPISSQVQENCSVILDGAPHNGCMLFEEIYQAKGYRHLWGLAYSLVIMITLFIVANQKEKSRNDEENDQ